MLRHLHIRNLAVIEEAAIRLEPGLNVVTGETGAGKSIVVDSVALLAGARATGELIRSGTDRLVVSGELEPAGEAWSALLADAGIDGSADEPLLVRREIHQEGRNRVFINDQPATLRLLAELCGPLLQIHSQREELSLTLPGQQRAWLDRSGHGEAESALAAVSAAWNRHRDLSVRKARLSGDERLRSERIDLLRFQIQEIDAARLVAGEDGELRHERDVLRHLQSLLAGLGGALEALYESEGSAEERLGHAQRSLEEVTAWEPEAEEWLEMLGGARVALREVSGRVRRRLDAQERDPRRLDAIEERLATVERLARKYGESAEAALQHRQRATEELAALESDASDLESLDRELDSALEAYREAALDLSARRASWAESLVRRVHGELVDLALAKARLAVELGRRRRDGSPLELDGVPVEMGSEGVDQVGFLFAPNPGEEPRPLARIVSGGELARVYLALQLAVRGTGAAAHGTLVFDEVDAGIGGAEAAALGEKLHRLARGGQILVVTHLAQVASHADYHLRVGKQVRGGRTRVTVEPLEEAARVEEVARMLAGSEITALSRSHAEELIAASQPGTA